MWIFSQSERIKTNLAQLPSKKVERIALQRWEEGGGRGVWKRGVGGGGGKAFHTADASLLGNNTSGAF